MSRVYWDTMLFIYLQEGNPHFGPQVKKAYEALVRRNDRLCTSVFTIGELLTLPKRKGNDALVRAIRSFMLNGEVEILPFALETAELYSSIRAAAKIKPADAIHLASAAEAGARLFITHDKELLNIEMPGMPLIVGLDGKVW